MLQEINSGYFVDENGNIFNSSGLQMKTTVDKFGYVSIVIKQKRYLVHRLVAEKFISDFSADKQVHHIDGNKTNNSISNLQVLKNGLHTKEHNIISRVNKEQLKENAQKAAEARKRTDVTTDKVKELRHLGYTVKQISEELHCGYNTVCRRLGMNV